MKPVRPHLGQPAIITGASSGLGRELAIAFSQTGHVILAGRNQSRLEQTRQLCNDPGNTTIVCGSLSSSERQDRLAHFSDLYKARFLVCCAGEYLSGKFETADPDKILSVLNTNLTDTVSLVHRVYPYLLRAPGPKTIVLINSSAGVTSPIDEAVYSASKHGLAGFASVFRGEAARRGVRVLEVFPGGIKTEMMAHRPDYDLLMDPKEMAHAIHTATISGADSLTVDRLTFGRRNF